MRRGAVFGLLAVWPLCSAQVVMAQDGSPPLPPPPMPIPSLPAGSTSGPAATFPTDIRYVIAGIEVRGNRRTDTSLILAELGIALGDTLTPDDPRVPLAELRLRALGYFVRAQLRLERFAARRGEVLLIVEVEERGTRVLNALYLGSSEATKLWGGLDISETNLFGRGVVVGAGAVASTTPVVPEAEAGHAFTLRAAGPARKRGLLLAGSFLYSSGSEFFQTSGRDDTVDPQKWSASHQRRIGGTFSLGGDLSRTARLFTEGRFESIEARLPGLRTRDLDGAGSRPVDFLVHEGQSELASLTTTLDLDSRSDPVMPAGGRRVVISLEASLPLLGSSYAYAKGMVNASGYWPTSRGHVVALHGFAGAVLGDAPYFSRFFVGDLNFLLPPRALGLNFATLPSRNVFGTNVSGRRYESLAARALFEYAVPLWRQGGFAYRGDFFLAVGVFGLADLDDVLVRDTGLGRSLPIDLTADCGLRLDTQIGIFTFSIANALGRLPF
jgi:outer membrane protein insertion porin family